MKKSTFFRLSLLLVLPIPFAAQALDAPGPGTSYSYPLPAQAGSSVNMVYTMASPGTVQIMAYNEAGDRVVNFKEVKPAGLQSSAIQLCCLAPGLYLYLITIDYDSGSREKLQPAKFVVRR